MTTCIWFLLREVRVNLPRRWGPGVVAQQHDASRRRPEAGSRAGASAAGEAAPPARAEELRAAATGGAEPLGKNGDHGPYYALERGKGDVCSQLGHGVRATGRACGPRAQCVAANVLASCRQGLSSKGQGCRWRKEAAEQHQGGRCKGARGRAAGKRPSAQGREGQQGAASRGHQQHRRWSACIAQGTPGMACEPAGCERGRQRGQDPHGAV